MEKLIAALLTLGALVGLFWFGWPVLFLLYAKFRQRRDVR